MMYPLIISFPGRLKSEAREDVQINCIYGVQINCICNVELSCMQKKSGITGKHQEAGSMEYKKGMKTVEDSKTEITKLLQYEHINGENRLFGGRLMAWIDEAAAVAAMRHAGGYVTTCAVDDLRFKKGAFLNDILVLIAKLTYVGRTSMEVRVDTYLEDRATGMRKLINHAYLVEVHVDEAGNPIPVEYGLELRTPSEKMEWEGACRRIEIRKHRKQEGF